MSSCSSPPGSGFRGCGIFDRSRSDKVASFAASVSREVLSGSFTSESSIQTAGSTDKAFGASKAVDWVAETRGLTVNVEPEAGSVDGLESISVVFSEPSRENPCEMTGNSNDCPKGAGEWCGIIVTKDGADGLLAEYGRLSCSRNSETGFAVSAKGKACSVSSTVDMRRRVDS